MTAGPSAESANRGEVAGNEPAFAGDHQAHRDPFRFVVVAPMQQVHIPTPAPKPRADPAASPAAPRVTRGRMMGLTSRRPWFSPRWVVTASAATSPARMLTFILFSTVQKRCSLGASGSGGTVGRGETLGLQSGAQQKNREEAFHGVPDYHVGKMRDKSRGGRSMAHPVKLTAG